MLAGEGLREWRWEWRKHDRVRCKYMNKMNAFTDNRKHLDINQTLTASHLLLLRLNKRLVDALHHMMRTKKSQRDNGSLSQHAGGGIQHLITCWLSCLMVSALL